MDIPQLEKCEFFLKLKVVKKKCKRTLGHVVQGCSTQALRLVLKWL